MPNYICVQCGNQFGASETVPDRCPICEDPRQYVNPNGQTWTTIGCDAAGLSQRPGTA